MEKKPEHLHVLWEIYAQEGTMPLQKGDKMNDILHDDKRPILSLRFPAYPHFEREIKVGEGGITEIEAYAENGEMAPVIWFAIKVGETIIARINGKYVEQVA